MFENLEDRQVYLVVRIRCDIFWCLCIALFGLQDILPVVLLFILNTWRTDAR